MTNKNFENTNDPNKELDENDILNDDMFTLSNMSNMISMSSMPNMYIPSMPTIVNINSGDALQEHREEKDFLR